MEKKQGQSHVVGMTQQQGSYGSSDMTVAVTQQQP
jgi:hypothetical protein